MKPNLFTYATSELSQDAIICWLLEWGKPENRDRNQELYRVGKSFLDSLFDKFDDIERPRQYHTIEIDKQHKNIDIFCVVNDEYAIIIEDKTNTKDHSGQLEKYFKDVNKKYDESKILPIYFKTGDQSNYSKITEKGYKIYLRKDFLTVLDNPFMNDILDDYKSYLKNIEEDINSYRIHKIDEWSWSAWKGFYITLQEELKDGNWDYVPNASGGFLGFWFSWIDMDNYSIYMQIENMISASASSTLKFKLASGTKEKVDKNLIHKWKKHILYDDGECIIKKPNVVRSGRWTTIGILDHEFRAIDDNGKINITMTAKNIKKIEQILRDKVNTIV